MVLRMKCLVGKTEPLNDAARHDSIPDRPRKEAMQFNTASWNFSKNATCEFLQVSS